MKSLLKIAIISMVAFSLSACLSEEDRIVKQRGKCEMYGFKPGTEQFAQCVQKNELAYKRENIKRQELWEKQKKNNEIKRYLKKQGQL